MNDYDIAMTDDEIKRREQEEKEPTIWACHAETRRYTAHLKKQRMERGCHE